MPIKGRENGSGSTPRAGQGVAPGSHGRSNGLSEEAIVRLNTAWMDKFTEVFENLFKLYLIGEMAERNPAIARDLAMGEAERIKKYAYEQVLHTTGTMRGERRQALGHQLIKWGEQVLQGQNPLPTGTRGADHKPVPGGPQKRRATGPP